MWLRYLGLVVLVNLPGGLQAQVTQSCVAPSLSNGYLVPERLEYPHNFKVSYGCKQGLKPASESWWDTIICDNGKWSHEPLCIEQGACIPPVIENAERSRTTNAWYEDGKPFRITCEDGYKHKGNDATAKCESGQWVSVPICEKSDDACGAPPRVSNAVIVYQGYAEVFADNSSVHYECRDGYTMEDKSKKTIYCIQSDWTPGPTCIPEEVAPGTGRDDSTEVRISDGHATSSQSGTQTAGPPSTSGSSDRDSGPPSTSGSSSTDSGPPSTSGSSSTDSGPFLKIELCGEYPAVPNGYISDNQPLHLKYKCNRGYVAADIDTVVCHSGGKWSIEPNCEGPFCLIDTAQYRSTIKNTGVVKIKPGETKHLPCLREDHSVRVECFLHYGQPYYRPQYCCDYVSNPGRCP